MGEPIIVAGTIRPNQERASFWRPLPFTSTPFSSLALAHGVGGTGSSSSPPPPRSTITRAFVYSRKKLGFESA